MTTTQPISTRFGAATQRTLLCLPAEPLAQFTSPAFYSVSNLRARPGRVRNREAGSTICVPTVALTNGSVAGFRPGSRKQMPLLCSATRRAAAGCAGAHAGGPTLTVPRPRTAIRPGGSSRLSCVRTVAGQSYLGSYNLRRSSIPKKGAEDFAILRTILTTARRQGRNVIETLTAPTHRLLQELTT